MGQRKKQIDQCLNGIKKYEKWGNLLAGQSWVHLFNSNAPVSASAIHNGLECVKAKETECASRQQAHQCRKRKSLETNRHRDSSNRRDNEA